MTKIVISGGTGFIGKALTKELVRRDYEVLVLSRGMGTQYPESRIRIIQWDGKNTDSWERELENAAAVINLAGENIGAGLWTPARKERILSSRLDAGNALRSAIEKCGNKPKLFVQASAIGIYGTSETAELNEDSPLGNDILSSIARQWEGSTKDVESMGVKRAIVRTGIVLDTKQGSFPLVVLPFRLFIGGRLGSGRQWFSWIHLEDEVNAIIHIIDNGLDGIFNLVAPRPARNEEVARVISNVMRRPNWFPVPAFALRLVLGEMSILVLEGQRVFPKRLLESGYKFHFEELDNALKDLFRK